MPDTTECPVPSSFSVVLSVFIKTYIDYRGSQMVKVSYNAGDTGSTPWVGKISLEKEMATHSATYAWKIPWTRREPGRLQSWSLRVGHDRLLHFHFHKEETLNTHT